MEERTIKISLEKAKEWYKAGGDLREVALQAYTEEELIGGKFGPESWEKYCWTTQGSKAWQAQTGNPFPVDRHPAGSFCRFDGEEEARAYIALGQLVQLRDAWWEKANWKPDWKDINQYKYDIRTEEGSTIISYNRTSGRLLAFPTREMCSHFFECFKHIIEEAKMFL